VIITLLIAALIAAAPPAPVRCSPPLVLLARNDKAFTVRFWDGTPRRRAVEANVRAAFKSACATHLLTGSTIAKLGGVSSRRLYLLNAPEANVASIYERGGQLVLEYPFVTGGHDSHVPGAADIEEAIFCAVHGASAKEQEESGRCLPD
jgi:hypothetical protein